MRRIRHFVPLALLLVAAGCADEPSTAPRTDDPDALVALALASAGMPLPGGTQDGAMVSGMMVMPMQPGMMGTSRPGTPPEPCSWSEPAQRLECDPITFEGITIRRAFVFFTTDGTPLRAPGLTTHGMREWVTVTGTMARHGSSVTMDRAADRTVRGLDTASRAIVQDAVERGTSSGVHQMRDGGTVRHAMTFADTVTGLTMPKPDRSTRDYVRLFPTAGRVVRNATVTVEPEGAAARTHVIREVVTFLGAGRAEVQITRDGVTRTCVRNMVDRTMTCS